MLVQKLEKETIVNERLIRRSMKEKASWLHRRLIIESSVCLLMMPFFLFVLPRISPVSMYFCSYSALFMLLAICYNYYMYRRFHPKNFIEGNLIEAKKETLNFKKQTQRWTFYIGIPFLITYVVFFVYENQSCDIEKLLQFICKKRDGRVAENREEIFYESSPLFAVNTMESLEKQYLQKKGSYN